MNPIFNLSYFPNIANFVGFAKNNTIQFEIWDNYTKQTYRNRAYIYGANGKLQLNIPVHHTQKQRQLYKDVKIANDTKWQLQHFKSLESAYRTSPFYEFYIDDLKPLFEKEFEFLMAFNFKCLEVVLDCLQYQLDYSTTQNYITKSETDLDYRTLVKSKREIPQQFDAYTQVFDSKHGFIPNLSILDLLFNEGPNSINYLQTQTVRLV